MTKLHKNIKKISYYSFATFAVGIAAGLSGMCLVLIMHYIQHVAFGYSLDRIVSNESFLQGVTFSSPSRRVVVLTVCGLVSGIGWWSLFRYGKPLISISSALKLKPPSMPTLSTIFNALLQIITVALGSPLGREVAPREVGALFGCWISDKMQLNPQESKIIVACGAGAGLAAVYNVPFGGAIFVMEVLLRSVKLHVLLPAIVSSSIAVLVSWIGLGNAPLYYFNPFVVDSSLIIFSIIGGPIIGIMAYYFFLMTTSARKSAPKDGYLLFYCLINFITIGLLSIYFPALLGNGKSPAQLEFIAGTSLQITACLFILRTLIVWSSLRAGAMGGLLTPSLATGALLSVLLSGLWNSAGYTISLSAGALIGASAFLAAAQKMPLTAIILIFELTHLNISCLPPILFAVAGSVSSFLLCQNFALKRN